MDMKTFTATWEAQDIDTIDTVGVSYAEALQQEIDNEIMINMMKMNGWFVVVLSNGYRNMKHPIDIEEWCNFTIGEPQTNWSNFGTTYLFKKKEYAEWFSLRWL